MFTDIVRIRVTGGRGGDGCCSFRREAYVPRGGPNGGDGGDGGAIYLIASEQLTSLMDLRYHSTWKGHRGQHGRGSDCHGKRGEDIYIRVPCGTLVRREGEGEILADLTEAGQTFCLSPGGKGGRGNARFTTSTNRTPRFAEKGEHLEEVRYELELKIIAEVGFVGLPNAGKSTLLSHITAATPKIADYPFTTIAPNLGIVPLDDYRTLSLADIPGIIEGAAQGKGLGHDFLRHIERTRVLLFLIDAGDEDPVATRQTLEKELREHSPVFLERPRVYALNKVDITENREHIAEIRKKFEGAFVISGATGEGLPELLEALWKKVDLERKREANEEIFAPEREYTFEAPFELLRTPRGFRVEGRRIERAVRMTDFENPEAVRHLQESLKNQGLFKALKRLRAVEGQSIEIGEIELEYHPD